MLKNLIKCVSGKRGWLIHPPSALKLKIRESIAEKLLKSVDKMRQLDLNDSWAPKTHKKSKAKLSFSDISDDKNSATNTSLCSGKSDTLHDHGYSVSKDKSIDILASPARPVDDSETRKDIFFDHGYSSVSKDKDISVSPLPVENLLTMSESEKSDLSNKIVQQLTQLSKVGHSILLKNNPEEFQKGTCLEMY